MSSNHKNKNSWISSIFKYASYMAIGGTGFILLLASIQNHLIYLPSKYGNHPYNRYVFQMFKQCNGQRVVSNTKTFGKQISYYIPPKSIDLSSPQTLWILTGGNAALAMYFLPLFKYLQDSNDMLSRHHALLIDYPGFGENSGKPSPESIQENMLSAVREVTSTTKYNLNGNDIKIGILGHSLGAAAGLSFSNRYEDISKISRIILISPFTSMNDMAKIVLPIPGLSHVIKYLLRHHYDNDKELIKLHKKKSDIPITIFHGKYDSIVPMYMGLKLSKLIPNIDFHEVQCNHNDIIEVAQNDILKAML